MPARRDLESICVIGSGPIVIGQACEFDYAGCQALKVLREEGYRTVVINGLTHNFVAMDARLSSTKSVTNILARLLNDLTMPGHTVDRILNGPTSEVWIDPWRS